MGKGGVRLALVRLIFLFFLFEIYGTMVMEIG